MGDVRGSAPVCARWRAVKTIRPTRDLGRPQEHGRVRTGEKTKSGAPRALSAFRFTSADRQAIDALAARYGGTVREWNEPKAAVQGQYEVLTEAAEIDVLLPEGALSTFYEHWQGSGCQRRCDGETCTLPLSGPDGDTEEAPCLCNVQGVMLCKPKVRLAVALPGIEFRGVWRLESSSWAAADEMASIEPLLQQVQARGILRAKLVLERRSKMTAAGKRNFTVPKLVLAATMEELASGSASLAGIPVHTEEPKGALGMGDYRPPFDDESALPYERPFDPASDDEITDAEVVEDTPGTSEQEKKWLLHMDTLIAATGLTRPELVRGLVLSATDGEKEDLVGLPLEEWSAVCQKADDLVSGEFEVTGVALDGRLRVKRVRA